RLSGVVPNLTFEADPKNPQIIHAIDSRLLGSPSYGLDQVLQDFDFKGGQDKLLSEISGRGIPLAFATSASKGDPLWDPGVLTLLQIKVHGTDTVRSLLSNFLPLRMYARVLWAATTERRAGAVTIVNFRGWHSNVPTRVPVSWQLYWLGEEHNVFFTIEESWIPGEAWNAFEFQYISREGTAASLEDELQRLSNIVPNFTYQADLANPRIIHIKDARLAQIPNYSPDQTVHGIELTGTPLDLTNTIARRGIGISFPTAVLCASVCRLPDQFTVLHVKAGPSTVRFLLTNFLPLETYSRVLWTTQTERRDGAVTQVDFHGRRLDKKTNPPAP
ncbi:MAG TPA: hypothetical protein VKE93_18225, partial [Candidatus Angelobacter sp.]|nr:hypothetical protein [Candidatus Angelobacter sp.]